jgi:hypothetical protein
MLFLMDVVGLKTVYYAFTSALDLVETKLEEANAKGAMYTVAAASAACAPLDEETAVPPRARDVTGVEQRQSRDDQRDSDAQGLIEVKMGCIKLQGGMISSASSRFFNFVNLVADKRQRRGTFTSRFLRIVTGVLIPLAGMATSAMYPASEGVINARALDEAPCVAGFDAISLLPPAIGFGGVGAAIALQMLSVPLFAISLRLCGYTLKSPLFFMVSVNVLLFTMSCIVAGVAAVAQAASGVAPESTFLFASRTSRFRLLFRSILFRPPRFWL